MRLIRNTRPRPIKSLSTKSSSSKSSSSSAMSSSLLRGMLTLLLLWLSYEMILLIFDSVLFAVGDQSLGLTTSQDHNQDTTTTITTTHPMIISFTDQQIPPNSAVDVNIGTYDSPFSAQGGRHRILIDPLFHICDLHIKMFANEDGTAPYGREGGVTSFCFAISNFTGLATFYEYSARGGMSSSLSQVNKGTSHGNMKSLSQRTVFVLEAQKLFSAIRDRQSTIYRLKMDMQGHELAALDNMKDLLREPDFITHIMAECFCPNKKGLQIFQIENSCDKMSKLLKSVGYKTKWNCDKFKEWGDLQAYKKGGAATDYLPESDFESSKLELLPQHR